MGNPATYRLECGERYRLRKAQAIKRRTSELSRMLRDLRLPGPRGEGLTGSADELVLNPLRRALGQFRAGRQAQLLLEVLAGGFDGLDAEMEGRRDLARAPPLADQAQHLRCH